MMSLTQQRLRVPMARLNHHVGSSGKAAPGLLWRATRLGVCFALVLGCSGRKPAAVERVAATPSAKPPPSAAAEVVESALAKAPEPDPPAAGRDLRTIWVTGSVSDRSGRFRVELSPLMEMFRPVPSEGFRTEPTKPDPGELELRLLDAMDVPIRMWPIPVVWGEETTRTGVFSMFIYEPPQFSRAAIYRDGIEVG